MAIRIPRIWPALQGKEGGFHRRPMAGPWLGQVGHVVNYSSLRKARPMLHGEVAWPGNILVQSPVGESHPHRFILRTAPYAEQLYLVLDYQAARYGQDTGEVVDLGAGISITATLLLHADGSDLDVNPAIRWSVAEGTLPTRVIAPGADPDVDGGFGIDATPTWPILRVHTPLEIDPSPTETPGPPRMLNLGADGEDVEADVFIETVNVRLVSARICVHAPDEVDA